jgi:hypothetical protein
MAGQTGVEGALPSCPSISRSAELRFGSNQFHHDDQHADSEIGAPISRDANTGAGQDFTGLAAAVQLRLRVAVGLQALQRCSGLLNCRARGSTVATHHFGGGTRIEKFMRSLACRPRRIKLLPSDSSSVSFQRSRSSMYRAPRFERGGCRRESCRECQFHLRYAIYD